MVATACKSFATYFGTLKPKTDTGRTRKQPVPKACDGQEGTSMVGDTKAPSAAEGHMEWRQTCWLKKVWLHKKSPKLFLTGDRTQWHFVSSVLPSVQCPQCYPVSNVLSATQCPVSSVQPSVQCPPTQWHCSCDRSSWNEEGGATSSVTALRWSNAQSWSTNSTSNIDNQTRSKHRKMSETIKWKWHTADTWRAKR